MVALGCVLQRRAVAYHRVVMCCVVLALHCGVLGCGVLGCGGTGLCFTAACSSVASCCTVL